MNNLMNFLPTVVKLAGSGVINKIASPSPTHEEEISFVGGSVTNLMEASGIEESVVNPEKVGNAVAAILSVADDYFTNNRLRGDVE